MSRTTVLLAAVMLVVAGVPATAAFAQESTGDQPGATFAGVVGVQGAEVEGEVASRALDRQLATAESNESRAAVVANETAALREQLADLHERRETLRERFQAGNVSRGEYRAKLARIAAQTRTLERRLNTTATAAEGIPEETLRDRGVNVSAIRDLRANASNMTDGEAAEAARQIAGNDAGKGLAGERGPPEDRGPPEERGPPDDRDNETETATEDDDRGPPEDRRNGTGSEAGSGNGEGAPPEDQGNASDAGEDRGNGTDGANGSGPPEDASGEDTATESDDDDAGSENGSDDRGAANETASNGSNGDAGNGSGSSGTGTDEGSDDGDSDDESDTDALETRRVAASLDR